MIRRRPLSVTVASVILGCLAAGAFGNAILWNLPQTQELLRHLPNVPMHIGGALFTLVVVFYGVSAASAAAGLWNMQSWAIHAYKVWSIAVLLTFTYLVAIDKRIPAASLIAFLVLTAFLLFAGHWYLKRRLER